MKILMMTNTYKPFTGGVPRSIDTFAGQYRKMGHTVKIVAPTFEGQEEDPNVLRVPALQNFNGTDFSVQLPIPFFLSDFMEDFKPDIIHSNHPFLLGSTALRLGARYETPVVFTFHTFYERYVHYLPTGESEAMRRFAATLAAGYANLCDHIIAPSRAVAEALAQRGVTKPIDILPTGVDVRGISGGDGARFRREAGIPPDAFVIGFVSRLAPEKNLEFLSKAVLDFVGTHGKAWFVVAGTGPSENALRERFERSPARARIVMRGNQTGGELHDLYNALDVFAFASRTETQGLVVAEAMAAGVPVVAVKASGVEDIVRHEWNGKLLPEEDRAAFARALGDVCEMDPPARDRLGEQARQTALEFSDEACARKALALYLQTRREARAAHEHESAWDDFVKVVSTEWNLLANLGHAAGEALNPENSLEQRGAS